MYSAFAKFFPGRLRGKYKALLKSCDIDIDPDKYVGFTLLFGIGIGLAIALNISVILSSYDFSFLFFNFLITFAVFEIAMYLWLLIRADSKAKFVESVLPDALLLMSMNMRSGMTTDRALIMAARPEFGVFEKELNRVGKQLLAGKDIKYALLEMTYRIRSKVLDRTVRLIIEGIESGGELSSLLQQTAEEIQGTRLIKNEVRANVLMYAIFIFFAAGIGAPLLFGISTYLVSSIGQQFAASSFTGVSLSQFGISPSGQSQVSPQFLMTFAVLCLAITSFFGGLIIGIVKNGEEKSGAKFIPVLFLLSMTVFFFVRMTLSGIFPAG